MIVFNRNKCPVCGRYSMMARTDNKGRVQQLACRVCDKDLYLTWICEEVQDEEDPGTR